MILIIMILGSSLIGTIAGVVGFGIFGDALWAVIVASLASSCAVIGIAQLLPK